MSSHTLTVYSILYHPTIHDPEQYENSCRGIFPAHLMTKLPELEKGFQPITFSVEGKNAIRTVHVCAHEFSAQEGLMYLPRSMMESAFLQDGEEVTVEYRVLPKATFISVQPLSKKFSEDYNFETAKSALEKIIVQNYPILQTGEEITLDTHTLIIRSIEPYDIVTTFDSDPKVDFLPALDDIEQSDDDDEDESKIESSQDVLSQLETKETKETKENTWTPFGGTGYTLSGGSITRNIIPSTTPQEQPRIQPRIQQQPSIRRQPRKPKPKSEATTVDAKQNFQAFAGSGHRLGT